MNIVVCVKYVPDAQSERTFRESDRTVDREASTGCSPSSTSTPSKRP